MEITSIDVIMIFLVFITAGLLLGKYEYEKEHHND
jgi:hypothetical protein